MRAKAGVKAIVLSLGWLLAVGCVNPRQSPKLPDAGEEEPDAEGPAPDSRPSPDLARDLASSPDEASGDVAGPTADLAAADVSAPPPDTALPPDMAPPRDTAPLPPPPDARCGTAGDPCCGGGTACSGGNACSGGLCCPGGQTGCGSSCVDTGDDGNNCGACGHKCNGGTCQNGACQPVTVATLPNLAGGGGMVVNGNALFFTVPAEGKVMKVNVDGSNFVTLASGQGQAWAAAADGTSVYWITYVANGTLSKVGRNNSGAAPMSLATGLNKPFALAVDGSGVYWAAGEKGTGTITRADLDGGNKLTLASGQDSPAAITTDGNQVYFCNYHETGMTVFRVNKTGGGLTPLASNQVGCYGIAVQGSYVYWTAGDKIMRTDKTGAGTPAPVATGQQDSLFVTVDSSGIYWTNNVPNGAAMRVSLSGGSAVVLVPGLDRPYLGALDANNFYFAANDRRIIRIAK